MKFGRLKLSVEGTNNGRGFDILYEFEKAHNFVEFSSKKEFMFIQPWMQFPSDEYTDECKLVSIELVKRFNEFDELDGINTDLRTRIKQLERELEVYRESEK